MFVGFGYLFLVFRLMLELGVVLILILIFVFMVDDCCWGFEAGLASLLVRLWWMKCKR